jgi:hypothetical protein
MLKIHFYASNKYSQEVAQFIREKIAENFLGLLNNGEYQKFFIYFEPLFYDIEIVNREVFHIENDILKMYENLLYLEHQGKNFLNGRNETLTGKVKRGIINILLKNLHNHISTHKVGIITN